MIRKIALVGLGIALTTIGTIGIGEQRVEIVPEETSPAVQVVRPEIEVLEHPVVLDVQMELGLSGQGVDTSMMILCATSAYRGEVHVDRQDVKLSLSIAGIIKELDQQKMFVSFDVESQTQDSTGGRGFAGSGAVVLEPGKPKTVLTIGGRSVLLTVRLAE